MKIPAAAFAALLAMIASLAAAGCVSSRVVRHGDLRPGDTFARSMVFLRDGGRYEFTRVAVYPDSVVGEYKVSVEKESETEGVYYEDELRAHRMALAAVDSLAELRRDPVKTALYGAGAAGVGFLVYKALNTSSSGKKSSGSSKPGSPL